MIKRASIVLAEGKPARYFITIVTASAVVATMGLNQPMALGHGGDNHDQDLGLFPAGTIRLLPDDHKIPHNDGVIGPVLPVHAMSVHNTLVWKKDKKLPLMLMFQRHSGYNAEEVANPDVIDFLITHRNPSTLVNAFGSSSNQFNSSFRRSFDQFAYGGYTIIHDVSQSVPTRISVDQTAEICQLWDFNHPDAFKYDFDSPPYSAAAITNPDANLNFAAFSNAGPSKGLFYDMYCPGFGVLTDGRAVFMGGHDMNSQNGNYRIEVFDPETETWAARPQSCMRKYFGRSEEHQAYRVANLQPPSHLVAPNAPTSETPERYRNDWNLEIYYRDLQDEFQFQDPEHDLTFEELRQLMCTVYLPHCNPHDLSPDDYSPTYPSIRLAGRFGTVTNPLEKDANGNPIPVTSDMKYARWYPTQITLPTNQIVIYAGWDRDESFLPTTTNAPNSNTTAMQPFFDANKAAAAASAPLPFPDVPGNADIAGFLKSNGDNDFQSSRIKQPVPEVYDAATDTTIALENAPFFHNAWYPNGRVVQTGPGRNDWKLAVNDGAFPGTVKAMANGTDAYKSSLSNSLFHNVYLFDVQAAMKDPNRNTPPTNALEITSDKYHTLLSEARSSHSEFTGSADIMELDKLGKVVNHKVVHVGGTYPPSSSTLAADAAIGSITLQVNLSGNTPINHTGPYNLDGTGAAGEPVTVLGIATNPDGTTATVTLAAQTTKAHIAGKTLSTFNTSKDVEEINFASLSKKPKKGVVLPPPKWEVKGELYQPGRQNYCTPLPDGTVMILGGNGGTLPSIEAWSLHTQLYDPSKPYDPANPSVTNSVRKMAKSLIPRDEHGIIHLMPDATVYLGGQNRNGIVVQGDSVAPAGDSDLGVPCGQFFRPPYLFDARDNPAERPVISKVQALIDYGKPFKVSTLARKKVKLVSMIRTGSMSHSINNDVRMVKLAFKQTGGTLTVFPPKLPGTAVGGYYMLFITDEAGVPSNGVKVQLGPDIVKRIGKPASKWALLDETGQ